MSNKIRQAEIPVLIQALVCGVALSEAWYVGQSIGKKLEQYIAKTVAAELILALGLLVVVVGVTYFFFRSGYRNLIKYLRSWRVDIFALLLLGSAISVSADGLGTKKYVEWIGKIGDAQLLLIVLFPIVLAVSQILRIIFARQPQIASPFFVSDKEIENAEEDLFASSQHAERFAERVLNGGASDSLVFGIDAPWGIGKSSFINFCCNYWATKAQFNVIVHRFEPLRYEQTADLAGKFVEDLICTVEKSVFSPSIRPLFSKYSRLVKGSSDFTLFGLKFEPSPSTIEDALENLEQVLASMNIRIIVVVDDLDRVGWSSIKNILFAVKRSFMLPNMSYVLCYDTENIKNDNGNEIISDVRQFLEKFVNVKVSLYLDSQALAKYVSSNFSIALKNNLAMDPQTLDAVKQALNALVDIYESSDFYWYKDILGDVRKIKRLINTLLLLEIDKADLENSDFDKNDLIHLLLLYVGYPAVFRDIYTAETNDRAEFFSLKRKFENDRFKYSNSDNYKTYVKDLPDVPKFILGKVFCESVVGEEGASEELMLRSRACFNSSENRNLERYLKLIVNLSRPDGRESYRFYLNQKDALHAGFSLEEIFTKSHFSFEDKGLARAELWRIIANTASEFNAPLAGEIVDYLVENIPNYSAVEGRDVFGNMRNKLIYALLKILDQSRWEDSDVLGENAPTRNPIADWIFGEGERFGQGILERLAEVERGALGIYDVMLFRLYCSADRGGTLFTLQNALSRHAGPNAPTQGATTIIALAGMREVSQKVFSIFKRDYISENRNFFAEVDQLSVSLFLGAGYAAVRDRSKQEILESELIDAIAAERSRVKSFVIYQLSNSRIDSGVGCGVYNEVGEENSGGIAKVMNDYLFELCFNPSISLKNYEYFLDYLLMNFDHQFGFRGSKYAFSIEQVSKVLDKERLSLYWLEHRNEIRHLKFSERNKIVRTAGYSANYEEDLEPIYAILDSMTEEGMKGKQ
ncbi:P-loop NTPase fold protein [Massilia sp. ZL223]|uniref:P-loop NTPase fold protein n=1 Tax=Massilia sp. ZL223 TaxID=2824904 RepID=UPI001B810D7C|nr:P-loop NTPase fold protein [Massilia sp. ZL223]MBQ5962562.1 hypothetical protein [Massilia sp. ZL223]